MAEYKPIANLRGPVGPPPNVSATATTGEPGTQAAVTQTGTLESPIFNFTVPRGGQGDQGIPGVNAVENDTAVGTYADTEGTATRSAIQKIRRAPIAAEYELQPLWLTGHSWVAGTTHARARFWERVQQRLDMGAATMMGRGGQPSEAIAMNTIAGSYKWTPTSGTVVMACCTINDVTLFGDAAGTVPGYKRAWEAILSTVSSKASRAANTSSFVYTSNWSRETVSGDVTTTATGGEWWTTKAPGEWFEFTFTGTAVDVFLISRTTTGGVVEFKEGSTVLGSLDLTTPSAQATPAVFKISGLSTGTHTIRGTLVSGADLTVDSYRIPSETPPPAFVVGEGVINRTAPGSTPHATLVEQLKTELKTIVARYPHATYVEAGGTGWDMNTMLNSDGTHPNDRGSAFIADAVTKAMATNRKYPAFIEPAAYTAPTGPTIPTNGTDGTGKGAALSAITSGYEHRYLARLAGAVDTAVTTWVNQGSATGADFTAPVAGPLLKQGASFKYLQFDGIDDYLRRAVNAQPKTVVIVAQVPGAAASRAVVGSDVAGRELIQTNSSSQWIINNGATLGTTAATGGWAVITAVFNGANSSITVNTGSTLKGNSGTNTGHVDMFLGRAGATHYNVLLAELVEYKRVLTDTEIQTTASRLKADYGIA